jgi:feruloyl esterase
MFLWILVWCGSLARAQSPDGKCATLAAQSLPGTQIDAAHAITVGSFTVPGSTNQISNLPPFCHVAGVIAPTAESRIRFEVWMPLDTWNGKFAGEGNGGWAGSISHAALADQLRRGTQLPRRTPATSPRRGWKWRDLPTRSLNS